MVLQGGQPQPLMVLRRPPSPVLHFLLFFSFSYLDSFRTAASLRRHVSDSSTEEKVKAVGSHVNEDLVESWARKINRGSMGKCELYEPGIRTGLLEGLLATRWSGNSQVCLSYPCLGCGPRVVPYTRVGYV